MSKKSINWLKIWIVGLIIGALLAIITVLIGIAYPQSLSGVFLSYIWGANINFFCIIPAVLIFDFAWSIPLVIIKLVFDKLTSMAEIEHVKNLPEIKRVAKVILKNTDIQSQYQWGEYAVVSIHTITFEFENKSRIVLHVQLQQYNQILEDDIGILTYKENQGHLIFFDFERQMQPSN